MNGIASAFSRAAVSSRARTNAHLTVNGLEPAPANGIRDGRHLLLIGSMIWVLVLLMIVPDRFDYAHLSAVSAPESGGIVSRLLWLALLAGGIILILSRVTFAWLLTRWLNFFLLAFVLLAAASLIWSIDPSVTARRLIRILTIVVDATAFALMGWYARRFQNVLRPIITIVLLGSIFFGLAWPDLAIHQETSGVLAGAWHGLANHKNGLGDIACIGLIFWFHAWLSKEVRILPALVGGSLAVACLVLSRSSTSLVAAGFTLLFLITLLRSPRALRRYMPWMVALFIATLLAYSLAVLQIVPGLHTLMSPIGEITGKDMSFTGRTDIWDIVSEHIRLHPLLGTGYGAYWTGYGEGTASYDFFERLNFNPGSAHNGYLEILNDLGALGLIVLFGYLAVFVVQSLRLLKTDGHQASLYLALFLQQAITNLSESHWFSVLSVDFVIITLATTALARGLLEHHFLSNPGKVNRFVQARAPAAGVASAFITRANVYDRNH